MTLFAGFDVEVYEAYVYDLGNVGLINLSGTAHAYYPPAGGPDGSVHEWVVPVGVRAITFALWGGQGGFATWAGVAYAPRTRTLHQLHCPVAAGDVVTMAVGGPAAYGNAMLPTLGNGPIRGGQGGVNDTGTRYGGAGGGASAIWIGGILIALAGGGGGWAGPGGGYTAPTNGHPDGAAGALSLGDPLAGIGGHGAGGGGAPGGAMGGFGLPGENGASVPCATDAGGPPSPEWAEVGFDPTSGLSDGTDYRNEDGRVLVWFHTPPSTGWIVGAIGIPPA